MKASKKAKKKCDCIMELDSSLCSIRAVLARSFSMFALIKKQHRIDKRTAVKKAVEKTRAEESGRYKRELERFAYEKAEAIKEIERLEQAFSVLHKQHDSLLKIARNDEQFCRSEDLLQKIVSTRNN